MLSGGPSYSPSEPEEPSIISSEPESPSSMDPTCPEEGKFYYPNSAKCESYFFCNEGKLFELECEMGESFNFDKQECDSTISCNGP